MLLRLAIVVSLALALPACNRESYSRSNTGFSSLDKRVLYDFRNQAVAANLPGPATARKLLSVVFPSYVSEYRECKPRQMIANVRGAAEGSFTAAGRKQIVYLVDTAECGAPSARATHRLLVFTAGELTANVEVPMGSTILGAYDLNSDGKQELLLEEETPLSPAAIIKVARLVEFDKEKLATVEDFGQIYDKDCAANAGEYAISASVMYYLPPPAGQKPRFTVELYRAPCPAEGQQPQWTRAAR